MFNRLFKPKEKGPLPDFKDVTVTLKPIFGIRPGIYLTVLFGLIALLLIFVLFFRAGLADGGMHYNFQSAPLRAGVWIDGVKAGATPCDILIPEGRHEITVSRPFFKPIKMKRDVSRYVFSLPFLTPREYVNVNLELERAEDLAASAFQEFTQWSGVEGFSTEYPYPPVLSEAAQSIIAQPDEPTYQALKRMLIRCLPAAHQPQTAADWLRACLIVESRGRGLTPGAFFRLIASLRGLIAERDNLPFQIYAVLPQNLQGGEAPAQDKTRPIAFREDFAETEGFKAFAESYRSFIKGFPVRTGTGPGGTLSLGGIAFVPVPGGSYVMGKNDEQTSLFNLDAIDVFPHAVEVPGFLMAQTEVTNRQFKLFLDENPDWRPGNRETLMSQNLVDEFYLKGWQDGTYPTGQDAKPAAYVSAFAAEAYCAWLSGKLKVMKPGHVVRLPHEAEWEWAAAGGNPARFKTAGSRFTVEKDASAQTAGASASNLFGLRDMAGNLWEICRDWYAKAAPAASSRRPALNAPGREPLYSIGGAKAVRGGSWASKAAEIEAFTRGSQPPEWCTAYLGFRPVIAKE